MSVFGANDKRRSLKKQSHPDQIRWFDKQWIVAASGNNRVFSCYLKNDPKQTNDDSGDGQEPNNVGVPEEFLCPNCGEKADVTTALPGPDGGTIRHHCTDCFACWTLEEIENCVECGKPLGGSNVRCYSCRDEKQ